MIGETNYGFCLREWELWYGDGTQKMACNMPMTDGKSCSDTGLRGPRCPYAREGTKLDSSKLVFITYPQANKRKDDGGGG